MDDLISRQAAIEAIVNTPSEVQNKNIPLVNQYDGATFRQIEILGIIEALPSAQPEPLTDKEQRIFLAAMGREEKVCKYKDSLVKTCHEIIRKVKGALWT